MEPISILLEVTGNLQAIYNRFRTRVQDLRSNEHELLNTIELHGHVLSDLLFVDERVLLQSAKTQPGYIQAELSRLHTVKNQLGSNGKMLDALQKQQLSRGPIQQFLRATSTKEQITRVQQEVQRVQQDLSTFNMTATAMHLVLQQRVPVWVSRGPGKAGTIPVCNVPPNPPWAAMNFRIMSVHGVPVTMEGRIAHAILEGVRGRCSSSFHETVVSIAGENGIGKSCALRGLVQHPEIASRFLGTGGVHDHERRESSGGVHYMEISPNLTYAHIIQKLAWLVGKSGGWEVRQKILDSDHLFVAVAHAYAWFRGRDCLFLINESLDRHPDWPDICSNLANLAKCSPSSAVVFASRKRVARGFGEFVYLSAVPNSPIARNRLLSKAGWSEVDVGDEECDSLLERVLEICEGRILKLLPVGNLLKLLREIFGTSAADAMRNFLVRYQRVSSEERCIASGSRQEEDRSHNVIISIVVEVLTEKAVLKDMPSYMRNVGSFMSSFCVADGGQWLSYDCLFRYWGLSSESEAEMICSYFVEGHFGCQEDRTVNGVWKKGFRLRHRDIGCCIFEAERRGEVANWLARRREHLRMF